jgi:uncharacterized protein involved in outer membrane biogenesis
VVIEDLKIDWSWTPRVIVEGLAIANAEWGSRPQMVTVGRLEFTLALLELARGRLVLPELAASRPDLLLETDGDGTGNWQLPAAADEESPAPVPIIHSVKVEDASLAYVDGTGTPDLNATIASLIGHSDGTQIGLSGEGELEGVAYRLEVAAGALGTLQGEEDPYPVDLDLSLGSTMISAVGTVQPPGFGRLDLAVSIEGSDLAELAVIDTLAIPPTPPYSLIGSLSREDDIWRLEELEARLGNSDLGGRITIDLGGDPMAVDADLVADVVDLVELKEVFAIPPLEEIVEEAAADDGLIVPDDAADLSLLSTVNGRLALNAKRFVAPGVPLDDFVAEVTLDGAVLRMQPAEFGVGGGTVRMFVSVYGDKDPIGIDVFTYIRDVSLQQLFSGTQFVQEMGGKIDGRVELAGRGTSPHALLAAADGDVDLVMSEGKISGLIIELIGLDVAEALGLLLGDDAPVPIRCLVVDVPVEAGVVKPRNLLLDTTDTLITGAGQLDLATETVDLTLTPEPKDLSLLSLRSEVSIEGQLADLSIAPDLASIVRLLPPIDLGTAEDAPCAHMLERARRED